ncbi:MAG: carotenoid 1,2-hydratase [Planctomycetes bacterium]|nr:carotenoid 1,2-hydratase [Planctomycetota bacterium]
MRRSMGILIGVTLVVAGALWWWRSPAHAILPSASIAAALSAPAEPGFARAVAAREFVFPRDHGPHGDFRAEWWYYTGNLATSAGRRFGYQLTIFRVALAAEATPRTSAWAASELYFAHFALSDISEQRFHAHALSARVALGIAGATADPFRVWVDRWSADGWSPTRLRADADGVAIDLSVEPGKPIVRQGDRGLSRKSADNASYYYSLTRMPTTGSITVDGTSFAVSGTSWMDREWSTSALAADQVGWDWFSLQLDDGRDLMLYRMRRADGSVDPFSSGTVVGVDGDARALATGDFSIAARGTWTSPRSGATYPSGWSVRVSSAGIDLVVAPAIADQELDVGFRYWEGAVVVSAGGRAVGRGYVELTGYERASP